MPPSATTSSKRMAAGLTHNQRPFRDAARSNRLLVWYQSSFYIVIGQIHTHEAVSFDERTISIDKSVQRGIGVPVYFLNPEGLYNLDFEKSGDIDSLFNGEK